MDLTAPGRAMARACELLEQIGAGKARGTDRRRLPAPHQSSEVKLERRTHRRAARHGRARLMRSSGFSTSLGFELSQPSTDASRGLERHGSGLARGHPPAGRSDRRSRPASRLRASADDVPRRPAGAAAVGSAHRARSARPHARCSAWGFPRRSRSRSSKQPRQSRSSAEARRSRWRTRCRRSSR